MSNRYTRSLEVVYCSDYPHPDDAIKAIGSNNRTLVVNAPEICDTDFTVPSNVQVRFERGGKWIINDGITVTFNGQLEAGLYQIFEYIGTGTLAGTIDTDVINPQWWGAVGGSDSTQAFKNAINMLQDGKTFYIPAGSGSYILVDTLTFTQNHINIIFEGKLYSTYNGEVLHFGRADNNNVVYIKGLKAFSSQDIGSNAIVVVFENIINSIIELKDIEGGDIGIKLYGNGYGVGYNSFYLGSIIDLRKGILMEKTGSGWVNANNFYNGRFDFFSDLTSTDGSEYLHIIGSNNNFYSPFMEGEGQKYVGFYSAIKCSIIHPRMEGSPIEEVVFDSGSSENMVIQAYTDRLIPFTDNGKENAYITPQYYYYNGFKTTGELRTISAKGTIGQYVKRKATAIALKGDIIKIDITVANAGGAQWYLGYYDRDGTWHTIGSSWDTSFHYVFVCPEDISAIAIEPSSTSNADTDITVTFYSASSHTYGSNHIHNGYLGLDNSFVKRTVITIADGDTTPDVSGGDIFITSSNTNATEITDLDNPTVGQIVTLVGGSDTNPSTITDGGNFKLNGNMTLGLDDAIILFVKADNYYIELGRSTN